MTFGDRLRHVIDSKGISAYEISQATNISQATLSRILNNSTNKPAKTTLITLAKYLQINPTWLQTGEGLETIEPSPQNNIRYWIDVDATAGGVQQFDDMVTDKYISLSIPEFRDCTDAVNLYGDSMVPLYKSGQIIILKEWKESFIDFGNVYLVVTKSGNRMVKYLRKGSDAAHILCVSENKEFDPFEIEKTDILRLYLVKGGISKNTL
ncbi:XRE family transcriptional regulator [Alistipes finegoldii]